MRVRRLAPPTRFPSAEAEADAKLFLSQLPDETLTRDAANVHTEIEQLVKHCGAILMSQLGARLRPDALDWLRGEGVKLQDFLLADGRYSLVGSPVKWVTLKEEDTASTTCLGATRVMSEESNSRSLKRRNTCASVCSVSTATSSSEGRVTCVSVMRDLLCTINPIDLEQLLLASQPVMYED